MQHHRAAIERSKSKMWDHGLRFVFLLIVAAVVLRTLVFSFDVGRVLPDAVRGTAFLLVTQVIWMHLMWMICLVRGNGSMVDFGWPAGFTYMAAVYAVWGSALPLRRALLCGAYIVCGIRFMFGTRDQGFLVCSGFAVA
jgi:steroid 5-alpha reductase family enzyme